MGAVIIWRYIIMVKDGYHKVKGGEVYTENSVITSAYKKDRNGQTLPAYVYRACKTGGYGKVKDVKYATFMRSKHLYIIA